MTVTRYPMNPDYCPIPPRCADCGQFCGTESGTNWPVWDTINPYDDMPDLHRCRCLGCAVDSEMEQGDWESREACRHAILGAVSG